VIVLTRRRFLGHSTRVLATAAAWASGFPLDLLGTGSGRLHAGPVQTRPRFDRSPFTLGVASGDPTDDGMVLWTRLAPDPLAPGGGMSEEAVRVVWEVADDERFARIVARANTEASPLRAHAVHVEVDGLRPARPYWYRFRVGTWESPVGRTRTAPEPSADVDRVRLAFASCQSWEQGYYTAHRHLAQEDVDAVLFLGDYIYEYGPAANPVRPVTGPEATTLEGYRQRYAQYKTDPDLQAAHAAFPFIVTWDDHEVDNDYANDLSQDNDPREPFLRRRAAAYQAYFEHMPLRPVRRPRGPDMPLYRSLPYGRLVDLSILDTRQYRTPKPCGGVQQIALCDGARDPSATILGERQREWLFDHLAASPARWHVLAQQVMMARLDLAAGAPQEFSMDKWTAYQADAQAVLAFFATRRASNPIVLSGDIHTNWACDLHARPEDPASPIVGAEFVGTSITSGRDGTEISARNQAILPENPHVKFHNGQRGYVRCTISRERWTTDYRVVPFVSRPGASVETRASLVVENGRPGVHRT
jgi:alkaline phosphatase D